MRSVQDKINRIIGQLESTAFLSTHKSAQEIAGLLLGSSAASASPAAPGAEAAERTDSATPTLTTVQIVDQEMLDDELSVANTGWAIEYYRPIYSHRKVIGKAIIFGKRAFRKCAKFLIEPLVMAQKQFNGSVVRALNIIRNGFVVLSAESQRVNAEYQEAAAQIKALEAKVSKYEEQNNSLSAQLASISQKLEEISSLNSLLEKNAASTEQSLNYVNNGLNELKTKIDDSSSRICTLEESACSAKQKIADHEAKICRLTEKDNTYMDIDYFKFEDRFRGNRKVIMERLAQYVQYFKDSKMVLDLGSGRGEFIELLTENNIECIGVEPYRPFVEYCRNHDLNVVENDAISFLKKQKDCTADGITAFQVIEHISTNTLLNLCRECFRVLDYGKVLILETPDPTCLLTFTNSFYLDPTHNNPIHPNFVKYLLEEVGFSKISVVKPEGSSGDYRLPLLEVKANNIEDFNNGINCISDLLFAGQDYAIIAEK